MGDVPQDDVLYNVVIGETVTGSSDDHYHVLQYGFKPASIDRTQEGLLKKTENGGIEVEFANTNSRGPDNKVYFKGQYAPCKEYECILIFDSSSSTFRLERLMGQGKGLRVVRKDQTKYTGKIEVPPDIAEPPEVPRQRGSTRPKPEPSIISGHSLNGTTTTTGSSPPDGDDGATPATKRARTTKKTSTTTKRPRKTAAKGAKEKPEAANAEEPDDLLALVESIESSVPSDTTSQGEEEDFLAAAFESDTPSETPALSPPFPSSTPIKPPPSLPSSTQPHQFPPIQPPNTTLGLPNRNGQSGYSNGVAAVSANGTLPNGAAPKPDGDSSSGSESESASESESESESASESSSESESENE